MTANTGSGVSLGFSTTLAATKDETGYDALTFLEIGELQTISGGGKTYTEVAHDRLNDRETEQLLGNFTRDPITVTVAADIDSGDASNQDALAAIVGVDAGASFRTRFAQRGVDRFLDARVVAAGEPSIDGANAVVTRSFTLRPVTDTVPGAV